MKISSITFNNFKPYYGEVGINLMPEDDKNIILIGGRNGQGKTSFLVGVVWCLYGSNISTVDKVFRDEVKGNYSKFLGKSLNKNAANEGQTKFSVEVNFSEVELAEAFTKTQQKLANITLKRSYDAANSTVAETFEILMDGEPNGLLSDYSDKANFVNDYLIPIDIAKFVFFDAEKIADIAQLGAKAQATLMDEAFGQVLGLNTYENLIGDLKTYEDKLKKEAAPDEISLQINTFESVKKQNEITIGKNEKRLDEISEEIESLKTDISEYTNQLVRRGDSSVRIDMNELRKKEEKLNEKLDEVGAKFNEVADLIPFAIMANKLEEVKDHIQKEESIKLSEIERKGLSEKTKEFAESLFNRPPLPENDIDLEQKLFYYNKAKKILAELDIQNQDDIEIEFEHDLDKSEIHQIYDVFDLVNKYSKDTFEGVFNEYMRVQNDYQEVAKQLRVAESSSKDEFIQDLQDKKKDADRRQTSLNQETGKLDGEIVSLQLENNTHQTKISNLLSRVQTSKQVEKQIKLVKKYIKVLTDFVKTQKEKKKEILEKSLLNEMKTLLNEKTLVDNVEMTILKNKLGLEVKLYDTSGSETSPISDFSKGQQQIYISALLKAILSESIHELPVFIDTPLGRLDQEHRDDILAHYYPHLSSQVVIFSTNTEIRVADLPKIKDHVAKSYLLENKDRKTTIHKGYFN